MKICLNAKQTDEYLSRADEILFHFQDREAIPDFVVKYPGKTIILTYYDSDVYEEVLSEIQKYAELVPGLFLLATNNLSLAYWCKDKGIQFYLAYPITSYDELTAALAMGSYYVRLGAPLFFDMDYIHTYFSEARIRLIPNIAYDDAYIHENGIAGTWIRPEDLKMYEPYAEVLEFADANLKKEQALFRIYIEDRKWPGDLNMLITNFNHKGVNRMIPSEVTEKRLNCRQICSSRRRCRICSQALRLADPEFINLYKEAKEANTLEQLDID